MNLEMFSSLVSNATLLFALAFIYGASNIRPTQQSKVRQILLGLLIGLFAIVIMMSSWQMPSGAFYDTRSILISVSGAFFGGYTTIVASIIAIIYRLWRGNEGVWAGVMTIVTSATFGIIWRYFRTGKSKNRVNFVLSFLIFGVANHILMLLSQLLILPLGSGITVIQNIWPIVMLIYPIATVFVALAINNQNERLKANSDLIQSEILLKTSIESPKNMIIIAVDLNYQYIFFNHLHQELMKSMYGVNIQKGKSMLSYFAYGDEFNQVKENIDRAFKGESFVNIVPLKGQYKTLKIFESFCNPIYDQNHEIIGATIFSQDITERQLLEKAISESEEKLRKAVDQAPIAIMMHVEGGTIIHLNHTWSQITGYTIDELPTIKEWIKKAYNKDLTNFEEVSKRYYDVTDRRFDGEFKVKTKYGTTVVWEFYSTIIGTQSDGKKIAMNVAYDITDRKKKDEEILYLSYHDHLTGLKNRRFYEQDIVRLSDHINLPITVVMADINGLKIINDAFGHTAGDELLLSVTNVMKNHIRTTDTLARIGGDEFVFLFPNTNHQETETIIEHMKEELDSIQIYGMSSSVTFGIHTMYDNLTIDEAVKLAEIDMYHKKLYETASNRSETIKTIMSTLHLKNPREEYHSKRVREWCQSVGIVYNLRKDEVNLLTMIGNLHDIGKIAIDDAILNKPGKLTPEEWAEVKRHPEIGYRILSTTKEYAEIAEDILSHHERYDGTGYPRGLKGEAIPWRARVIAIVDAFDAMTTNRPYRKGLSQQEAINELMKHAGTQFDADIAKKFVTEVLKESWNE